MDKGRGILQGLLCLLTALFTSNANAGALQDEQHCLALAIYWEPRGEGRRGMVAVGWTILNRTRSEDSPKAPCAVVDQGKERSPCQFSWRCDGESDWPLRFTTHSVRMMDSKSNSTFQIRSLKNLFVTSCMSLQRSALLWPAADRTPAYWSSKRLHRYYEIQIGPWTANPFSRNRINAALAP